MAGLRTARGSCAPLLFGGVVAAAAIGIGVNDLENYELSFFSLARGTAAPFVTVFGQPVYTLSVGFGARLPLHGSLGASPAALVAPVLPAPLTYWFLLTLAIAAAVLVALHALQPLCGRLVSWLAAIVLFCSPPFLEYTVFNDWPETAVTDCAFIASVFAPHAWLSLHASARTTAGRVAGGLFVAATVWSLLGAVHPGYWPLLAVALVLTAAVALCRTEYSLRLRVAVVAALAVVALTVVVLQAPDILRELNLARAAGGGLRRHLDAPQGLLIRTNLFPFGEAAPRRPFTYLLLALSAFVVGSSRGSRSRMLLTAGCALMSAALGVAAAHWVPGTSVFVPTATWALRDPASVFAVFAGASAVGALEQSDVARRIGARACIVALLLASLQGLAYVGVLVRQALEVDFPSWTQSMTDASTRLEARGLPTAMLQRGARIALWPGTLARMRNLGVPVTDFADAGIPVVTAATKQRMMRALLPDDVLFEQTTELSSDLLCNPQAIQFLQIRYLVTSETICPPWQRVPGVVLDRTFQLAVNPAIDSRAWGMPVGALNRVGAALAPESGFFTQLRPIEGAVVEIGSREVEIRLRAPHAAPELAVIAPIAYDSGWRTSDAGIRNGAGFLAFSGVTQQRVVARFDADAIAQLRAALFTSCQLLGLVGLVGLATTRRTSEAVSLSVIAFEERVSEWWLRVSRPLRGVPRVAWLYAAYSTAAVLALRWTAEDADETGALTALTVPVLALLVSRIPLRRWATAAFGLATCLWIVLQGSHSERALVDPLFWALLAGALWAASVIDRLGRIPSAIAAFAGGVATTTSVLVLLAANGATPPVSFTGAGVTQALGGIAAQIGTMTLILLLMIWLYGIVFGSRRPTRVSATSFAARGALLAAFAWLAIGGVPTARGIQIEWAAALGVLLGLAAAPCERGKTNTARGL